MGSEGVTKWSGIERRKTQRFDADWQASIEAEKAALARTLHDHTGGMLVAARMDISWTEKHLDTQLAPLGERLARARLAIDEVIDLNRKIIEDLHPTILDNLGLVAALDWHVKRVTTASNIRCTISFPEPSPIFGPRSSIAVYRIVQSVLALLVKHGSEAVSLHLAQAEGTAMLSLDGAGFKTSMAPGDRVMSEILSSARSRLISLRGDLFCHFDERSFFLSCRLPAGAAPSRGRLPEPR